VKKALFITVRKDSSRLPNKAVKKILGCTVLEMIIKRAKLAKNFAEVIVCTTVRQIDDEVAEIAAKNGAAVYRGDLEDKLARWNGAAKKYNIDYIVTFDGDDLFCEPELLDMGAMQIEKRGLDFIEAPKGLICGAFTYAFTAAALEKVCEIKASKDTEMMWTYFKDTGLFKTGELENVPPIYFSGKIRMTLDYPEDFEFFSRIFEHFGSVNNDVPLSKIVEYLRENPHIPQINIHRQQEFLNNQKKKTHLELKENVQGE
jgi:spore coat polysaccharide biosynthesis protein SpsF